jgi:hypothetical protein
MATVSKFPRQLAPIVGQRAATTGVKFRPGSPSIPGELVASGLVWRFGTLDCVSDNLACFEDSFSGSGSFLDGFFEGCEFHHVPRANNNEADWLSKIGSTKQDIPAGVSLEIIRKPSIKPSPESTSIFVPGDPTPAQAPPPDSGAAASGLKEAAGQPSAAGSTKDSGAAISGPVPTAGQPGEAAQRRTRGLLIPRSPVSSTYGRYHPGQSHSPTTSSLGTCLKTKQKLGDSNVARWRTPPSIANCTSAACLESSRSASSRRKE